MKLSEKLSDLGLNFRRSDAVYEDLPGLEAALTSTLVPVDPRPQFVSRLRGNLLKQLPDKELAPSRPQNQLLQTGLLVTSGILGSAVLVLTGVRGFVSLIGVAGLLISWFRQNSDDSIAPTPSNLAH